MLGGGGKAKRQTIAGLAVEVRQQGARVESLDHEIKSTNRTVHSIESNLENFMRSFEEFKNNFSQPVNVANHASQPRTSVIDTVQPQPETPQRNTPPVPPPATPRDPLGHASHLPAPPQMPTPAAMVREENRHGNLDTLVAGEEFNSLPSNGKPPLKDLDFIKLYIILKGRAFRQLNKSSTFGRPCRYLNILMASSNS